MNHLINGNSKTLWKQTLFLRLYTLAKIPLIAWLRPSVMEMRQDRTVIRIRLSRRTKNHLNSMYFGALAVGAELVVAAKAVHAIEVSKMKVDFVFKDFKVEFFKRAEGDVFFICDQGLAVEALVAQTLASGERVTRTFQGYGVVPSKNAEEKILQFDVTLSVKRRRS